ncbi:MAG: hypothetical protein WC350_05995 [Candidatus Micrarchaeia archaeon]|jgi:hypothetical protein
MSILTFAPENRFYDKIRNGPKIGTIRDKPKKVGETLYLWEKKRGQKKGWYCGKCLTLDKKMSIVPGLTNLFLCHKCNSMTRWIRLPRKIAEKKCTACQEIRIIFSGDFLRIDCGDGLVNEIDPNTYLHPFARGEGFNSNREMIEWFRKHLKEGVWEKRYWIRWD